MGKTPIVPYAFLLLGLFQLSALHAEDLPFWSFEDRDYYSPLIAGVREAQISALALAWADRMPFLVNPKSPRNVWDIDVGGELPLVGWESRTALNGNLAVGAYGVGLWLPIDFHMIEDLVDASAPIVNTDYRFGLMVKVRHQLSIERSVAARIFVGHESTHLGDEFSIVGQRVFSRSFERINVSWEYLDLGLLYTNEKDDRVWSIRGGLTTTLPFHGTYYATDPGSITQSPIGPVTPSKNWIDPYAGYEYTWVEFIPPGKQVGYDLYLSSELRWRSVYDYHKARPDAAEDRQASLNLILGIKKNGKTRGFGRVSPFVRYYHGVNPNGQFRNQKNFTEFGAGLRLVR